MKINAEDKLYVNIATICGAGRVPFASGTFACILALPFYLLIHSALLFAIFTVLVTALGFAVCTRAEKALGKKDHKFMVIDDFSGMLVTFLFVPFDWRLLWAGFFLFRMFDMLKIFPANWMEKQYGSLGVVGDDLVAGIYANIILRIAAHLIFKV